VSGHGLEVANGHNAVHNEGDEAHPSTEAIWDAVLSAGAGGLGTATAPAFPAPPVAPLAIIANPTGAVVGLYKPAES